MHPGPRLWLLEGLLLVAVGAEGSLAAFIWSLARQGRYLPAVVLGLLALALLALSWVRAHRVFRFRRLARRGVIAVGRVVSAVERRMSLAPRVDAFWPLAYQPLRPVCEVAYSFEDDSGATHRGRFMAASRELPRYFPGQSLEIFYDPQAPGRYNAPSLVLRWYFRLGGATQAAADPSGSPGGGPAH